MRKKRRPPLPDGGRIVHPSKMSTARLSLAPCEGVAHVGETTLSRAELDELRRLLESDEIEKRDIIQIIKTLKITLNDQYDLNLVKEAEEAISGKGTRRNTVGRAVNYLLTIINRVFPKSMGGRRTRRNRRKSKSRSTRRN